MWKSSVWRHKDDDPSRDDAIARMAAMIAKLVEEAQEKKLKVAPFITVGCPGLITRDGLQYEGRRSLGNLHDWHGPRECPVYQPVMRVSRSRPTAPDDQALLPGPHTTFSLHGADAAEPGDGMRLYVFATG